MAQIDRRCGRDIIIILTVLWLAAMVPFATIVLEADRFGFAAVVVVALASVTLGGSVGCHWHTAQTCLHDARDYERKADSYARGEQP
jgi:hypothetical protein